MTILLNSSTSMSLWKDQFRRFNDQMSIIREISVDRGDVNVFRQKNHSGERLSGTATFIGDIVLPLNRETSSFQIDFQFFRLELRDIEIDREFLIGVWDLKIKILGMKTYSQKFIKTHFSIRVVNSSRNWHELTQHFSNMRSWVGKWVKRHFSAKISENSLKIQIYEFIKNPKTPSVFIWLLLLFFVFSRTFQMFLFCRSELVDHGGAHNKT